MKLIIVLHFLFGFLLGPTGLVLLNSVYRKIKNVE
jgi:hypothetical protein